MSDAISTQFKIDRVSTVDQVADMLRRMIWAGELEPGYRIREIPLSKNFGVSRNTMRDAIRMLVQEGLIDHELHRGGTVAVLDAADVIDIYAVRRVLELEAVSRSSKSQPELADVERTVMEIERAVEAQDWDAAVQADGQFHAALVSLLGSPRLSRFFDQIGAEYRFAIGVLWLQDASGRASDHFLAEDLGAVAAEHRQIYDLIAAGERATARKALASHLDINEKRLTDILKERNPSEDEAST